MFGIALKTCINCCCFLKKKNNCNAEFSHDKNGDDIGVALAKFDFFSFETVQYTLNIRINNYIHNMRGNNRQ